MEFIDEVGTCRGFKRVIAAVTPPIEGMESTDPVLRSTLRSLKAECVEYGTTIRTALESREITPIQASESLEVFVMLRDSMHGLKVHHRDYLFSVAYAAAGIRDPHLQ